MIEELSYSINSDEFGNVYGTIPPSTKKIVDKINEIIEYLNNQKK